jgi:hypothetical protein
MAVWWWSWLPQFRNEPRALLQRNPHPMVFLQILQVRMDVPLLRIRRVRRSCQSCPYLLRPTPSVLQLLLLGLHWLLGEGRLGHIAHLLPQTGQFVGLVHDLLQHLSVQLRHRLGGHCLSLRLTHRLVNLVIAHLVSPLLGRQRDLLQPHALRGNLPDVSTRLLNNSRLLTQIDDGRVLLL